MSAYKRRERERCPYCGSYYSADRTFSNATVGDRIWSIKQGWGTVIAIAPDDIVIYFDSGEKRSFYKDGRHSIHDTFSELSWQDQQNRESTPLNEIRKKK